MHSTTRTAFLSRSHHHSFCSLLWFKTIPVTHNAIIENRICFRWGAALYWSFWPNQEEVHLGIRSLATVLTAQGESGFHPRLAPMHSRLVVPVTAAAVMTLKHWPQEEAPFTYLSLSSKKEKHQVKARGSWYSHEKQVFPLWICVNFIKREGFGLDILHLRQYE